VEKQGVFQPQDALRCQVALDQEPTRIDKYLTAQFPSYSRTFFSTLINGATVTVNGEITRKPSTMIKPSDEITVLFPKVVVPTVCPEKAHALAISMVASFDHFLIINKPAGIMTHKPMPTSPDYTVVEWLLASFETIANVGLFDRPGIVHRLDKDTSGLLVIARTNYAHTHFSKLFKERMMQKTYLAVVHGHPPQTGSIDLPIGRHRLHRNRMATFAPQSIPQDHTRIRSALTSYNVLRYFHKSSLVQVNLHTGRTHQIRVHFAAKGHPLIGDTLYGASSSLMSRQALHAHKLSFCFDEQEYSFTQEPPEDFVQLLESLTCAQKD
jgi:23S rRNA pseudouridine1911/1915/1917 synthase